MSLVLAHAPETQDVCLVWVSVSEALIKPDHPHALLRIPVVSTTGKLAKPSPPFSPFPLCLCSLGWYGKN